MPNHPPVLRPARARDRRAAERRAMALGGAAAAAAAGFAALAAAAARRQTAAVDERVRAHTAPRERHPARRAAAVLAPAGTWRGYVPAALALAGWLVRAAGALGQRPRAARRRRAGAGAVVLAGGAAAGLAQAFDRWLPQPPAPPGHRSPTKPVFPSGHTFGPGAVGLTAAWVLTREGLAAPAVAWPLAVGLPLAGAAGKLIEEKHWLSDVGGGALAAVALAAACAAGYELSARR